MVGGILQSHSSAKHGAIVIDFIPLLWKAARIKFVIVVDCVGRSTDVPLNNLPQITVRPNIGIFLHIVSFLGWLGFYMKVSGVFFLIFSPNWSYLKYGNSVPRNRRFFGPALFFLHFLNIFRI